LHKMSKHLTEDAVLDAPDKFQINAILDDGNLHAL